MRRVPLVLRLLVWGRRVPVLHLLVLVRQVLALKPVLGLLAWVRRVRVLLELRLLVWVRQVRELRLLLAWERLD